MNPQEIFAKIQAVVAQFLSINQDNIALTFPLFEITSRSSFYGSGISISGDELIALELIMKLEEEFNIQIPEQDLAELKTVQDAVTYIFQRFMTSENTVSSQDIGGWIEDLKQKVV